MPIFTQNGQKYTFCEKFHQTYSSSQNFKTVRISVGPVLSVWIFGTQKFEIMIENDSGMKKKRFRVIKIFGGPNFQGPSWTYPTGPTRYDPDRTVWIFSTSENSSWECKTLKNKCF